MLTIPTVGRLAGRPSALLSGLRPVDAEAVSTSSRAVGPRATSNPRDRARGNGIASASCGASPLCSAGGVCMYSQG